MKLPYSPALAGVLAVLVGIGAIAFGSHNLRSEKRFHSDRNPFAIQKSAYGRRLARLSEDTIDRVWHLGVEKVVPHNIDGSLPSGGVAKKEKPKGPEESALKRAKNWFADMRIAKYARTNSTPMSGRHLAKVHKDIEEMLLRSYKMDPGHYGAYNSYHLFLTIHKFGGTPQSKEHARKIAQLTIDLVSGEDEDPEPWITAAAAAMNLYLLEAEAFTTAGQKVPVEVLEKNQKRIGRCMERYEALMARAKSSGNWDNLTFERQYEISQRGRFATRTYAQFEPMIARAKSRALPAPDAEAEIAQSTDSED